MFQKNRKAKILTALMLAVLLSLGLWQVQRLAWKTDLLARMEAQMAAPPVDFPESLEKPQHWEYRQVKLTGSYMADQRYVLQPRTHGGRVGVHLLVPFRLQSGGIVFVNMGWLPQDSVDAVTLPAETQTIAGVVQLPYQGMFTPDNDPAQGFWYWADLSALAKAAGVTNAAPVLVTLPPQAGDVYPAGFAVTANIRNDHLQYAFFWFGMALILVIVYTISQRKKGKDQHAGI
jgi:surfeit locus 1 family protein